MKTLPVFLLAASLLLRQATAAPTHDLTLRVAPERDLVYRNGSLDVVVQIDLEGRRVEQARRVPMNLAIVLDRSGSMQGAKIEKARQAACVAVDQLADDDYFSLVTFDNETDLLIPPSRVGDRRHREALKERIDRIRPGGSTAIHAGLTLGAEQLRRFFDKEHVNRVVLLSDGLANVGPRNASDFASLGRDLRQQSMSVTTIGLGDDYNEDLMTALAEASNANYYYVRDAEKLPGIFAEELGAARSLIARGVSIRITVPDGVRIREIIGRPEIDCTGRSVDIQLPEYFAGDKRRFLALCRVEPTKYDALELAKVDLLYASETGEKLPDQQEAVKIRITDVAGEAEKSLRTDVAREVAIVQNRLAKEQAVKLADQGRVKESAEILRNQARANAAAPAAVKLPEWDKENQKLEDAAREVESKGQLGKSSRKQIQYENWQDKYQKR
jgi:Ca-activated chloride channel family protein